MEPTEVNRILSQEEINALVNKDAAAIEAEAAGLEAARDPWRAVPSAHAPVAELIAEIDRAVAVLRKSAANSADLAYCCGYLEGFRELLARGEENNYPKPPISDA